MTTLAESNTAFAIDLFHALGSADGNLFFSPHSVSAAMAMTYAGADGETARQMAEVLHFDLPQSELHRAFRDLDDALASRATSTAEEEVEGFRLRIANALWGDTDYSFLPSFLQQLEAYYGASLRRVSFQGDPEGARERINQWVSEATEGKVPELIATGVLDTLTRLVLTNAVYFNAAWRQPFQAERTADEPFTTGRGESVTVPMMHQRTHHAFSTGAGYQAVELPYVGNELAMLIILPDAGTFGDFESALTAERLDAIIGSLSGSAVNLAMPRFRFESDFELAEILVEMGMPDAFDAARADFSSMEGGAGLYIAAVLHKAFIDLNEAGTEAAAATAVVMALRGGRPRYTDVTVDRPFLFVIRDRGTAEVIFMGRVVDPR